jgi:hypothetical protein
MGFINKIISMFSNQPTKNKKDKINANSQSMQHVYFTPQIKRRIWPSENRSDLMEVNFAVVGLKYENDDGINRQDILINCKEDQEVFLKRNPIENYPNAIQVFVQNGCIGYISEYDNKRLAKYMDKDGKIYDAHISRMYINTKNIVATCEITFWRNKMR